MLKIINQGLLLIESGIIAHCCNTLGCIGGLAGKLAKKYPAVYKAQPVLYLGGDQLVKVDDNLYVFNMITQSEIGTHKVQTNFDALETCLKELNTWSKVLELQIYLPYYLGSWLTGGSTPQQKANTWDKVSQLILDIVPQATICKVN